jgi:hypothetical protein
MFRRKRRRMIAPADRERWGDVAAAAGLKK